MCGGDIGARLVERGAVVTVIDPGQHVTGVHRLVVAHQHLREVSGDFRAKITESAAT